MAGMTSQSSAAESSEFVGRLAPDVEREEASRRAKAAADEIKMLLDAEGQVGDLIRMDFDEAHILLHDALREQVGGVRLSPVANGYGHRVPRQLEGHLNAGTSAYS